MRNIYKINGLLMKGHVDMIHKERTLKISRDNGRIQEDSRMIIRRSKEEVDI